MKFNFKNIYNSLFARTLATTTTNLTNLKKNDSSESFQSFESDVIEHDFVDINETTYEL